MLAIVGGIGSILLFQGMNAINSFNSALSIFDVETKDAARESLVIAHVRFHDTDDVTLWIRNTGTIDVVIDTITMVRIDTQELLLNNSTIAAEVDFADQVPLKDIKQAGPMDTSLSTSWGSVLGEKFRITVTTTRGSSFDVVAKPLNT